MLALSLTPARDQQPAQGDENHQRDGLEEQAHRGDDHRRQDNDHRDAARALHLGPRQLVSLPADRPSRHVAADHRGQPRADHPDRQGGPHRLVGSVEGGAGGQNADRRRADDDAPGGHDRREDDPEDESGGDSQSQPLADGEEHGRAGRLQMRGVCEGAPTSATHLVVKRGATRFMLEAGFRQHVRLMSDPQKRGKARPGADQPAPRRRAHTTSRDLERYAGLFARRTQVMRSSAMRDLMAITARPEVISLAGGLPDTSTFPSGSFAAQMTRIAHESSAEALQYGPTEGFEETKACIVEVMAAEGMAPDANDLIVTTGGQQAIDLITKTLVNPGDPVICEAPTYPGAVPTFCSYEADVHQVSTDDKGMRIDELEELLAALGTAGRRPKFIYS